MSYIDKAAAKVKIMSQQFFLEICFVYCLLSTIVGKTTISFNLMHI